MSQSDRAIRKLATQLARLDREVKSWRGAQADFTSIENGGNFTFKDGDGNVTAIMGGQDDGSNTIRHVDGPVPPIPSGLTAHVDGPIVQVSWDGTFEDADEATYDWSHLEVVAVGPSNEQLTATINDVTGASASVAATVSGEWTVVARSVSRAEKRSLDGDAGTVEVKLVDIDGAIDAVQDSANGKNKVTYSDRPPTPDDPGIFDDTWFVGQVGRPNDVVEATNLARNPTFTTLDFGLGSRPITSGAGTSIGITQDWASSGITSLRIGTGTGADGSAYIAYYETIDGLAGKELTLALDIRVDEVDASNSRRRIGVGTRIGGVTDWWYATSPDVPNAVGVHRVSVSFTMPDRPSDSYFVRVMNPSTTNELWVDSASFVEGESSSYFDGDTEDGETDDDPHYRWTGEPYASASEKYLPALNIGDSDNWNVIEQYRHDGTGWVRVELSHRVFSTVDLGKATVGELDGIRIMGKTVRGEQLSGDAIDGKVITGATYRTSGGNGSWSDAGLFISQPDGTSMVQFPTDGSPLSLTASDTQIERASIGELDVANGAVRSGGQLTLASGVTAPPSPPELTTGWQKSTTLTRPDVALPYDWTGLGYWDEGDGHWVRAVNVLGSAGDSRDRIEVYDATTGAFQKEIRITLNPRAGVTVIGDIAYVLGPNHEENSFYPQYVDGYDLNTGEKVSWFGYERFATSAGGKLAIGNDGTNLVVAGVTKTPNLYVMRYDPATGVQVGSDMSTSWPSSGGRDLYGARVNGNEVGVVTSWGERVYLNNNNTLVRKTDTANESGYAGWVLPAHDVSGCVWVSGAPYPVDSSGTVYEGAAPVSDSTMRLCYTWWDGTHETTPSPIATVQVPAWQNFYCSLPARAGLSKRVYVEFSAAPDVWYRTTVGEASMVVSYGDFSGGSQPLPTTNTFPVATPAVLKSNIGGFEVKGDGSGSWGPLTFNADGTMTSTQIPDWVPITSFLNSASPAATGFAPAYRVWPDGKAEWRGAIQFPSTTSTTELLTVPPEARPVSDVHVAAAAQSPSTGAARIDVCDPNAPTSIRVVPGGSKNWVSLDGLYYYLT